MKGRRRDGWFVSAFVYFSFSSLFSVGVRLLSFIFVSSSLSIFTGFSVSLLPVLFCLFFLVFSCASSMSVCFFVLHFVSIFFSVQPSQFLFLFFFCFF